MKVSLNNGSIYLVDINTVAVNPVFNTYVKHTNPASFAISVKAWSYLDLVLRKDYDIFLASKDICFNDDGKPYLKDKCLCFNISHAKDLLALMISKNACGIDLEYERKLKPKTENKILSLNELNEYYKTKDKNGFLLQQWTKKEAFFKMKGSGISFLKLKEDWDLSAVATKTFTYNKTKYYLSYITEGEENANI